MFFVEKFGKKPFELSDNLFPVCIFSKELDEYLSHKTHKTVLDLQREFPTLTSATIKEINEFWILDKLKKPERELTREEKDKWIKEHYIKQWANFKSRSEAQKFWDEEVHCANKEGSQVSIFFFAV